MTRSIGAKLITDLIKNKLYYSVIDKMMDTFVPSCNAAIENKYFEIQKVVEQTVGLESAPPHLFSEEFRKKH